MGELFIFCLGCHRVMGHHHLGCGARLFKFFHILLNLVFLLAGAALLGVGAWLFAAHGALLHQDTIVSRLAPMSIGAMVLGGFVFFVSLIGCCASCKESRCLLNLYAIILLVIIACQVALGVYGFVHHQQLEHLNVTQAQWESIDITVRNDIEEDFDCCGWTTYDSSGLCAPPKVPYTAKCEQVIVPWFKKNFKIFAIVALCIGAVQIFALVVACCLSAAINAAHRQHDREKLLRDAREANRMPPANQPTYSGYGYQQQSSVQRY